MTHSLTFCHFGRALVLSLVWLLASCGGGGGSSNTPPSPAVTVHPGANVQALRVGPGPAGSGRVVEPALHQRAPLRARLQHQLPDDRQRSGGHTGSTGLRLLNAAVSLPLPLVKVADQQLYNCVQFIDQSYMWGPVATADVYLGGTALDGEKAASLRIQLAGTTGAATAPSVCASTGFTPITAVSDLGANGVLGIGPDREDCGIDCEFITNNGYYHVDQGGGDLTGIAISRAEQLLQPVTRFAANDDRHPHQLARRPLHGCRQCHGRPDLRHRHPGEQRPRHGQQDGTQPQRLLRHHVRRPHADPRLCRLWLQRVVSLAWTTIRRFPRARGPRRIGIAPPSALTLQAVNSSVDWPDQHRQFLDCQCDCAVRATPTPMP